MSRFFNLPPRHGGGPMSTGMRFAAGYEFMGRPVWRGEFSGTLSSAGGTKTTLYSGGMSLAVIEVRGYFVTSDGFYRPLWCKTVSGTGGGGDATAGGLNGATVGCLKSAPRSIFVFPSGAAGTRWLSATYKLQIDWIEGGNLPLG